MLQHRSVHKDGSDALLGAVHFVLHQTFHSLVALPPKQNCMLITYLSTIKMYKRELRYSKE